MSTEHEELPEGDEAAPPGVRAMALVRWGLVALMATAAVAAIAYHFGAFEGRGGAGGATATYYCPMHPQVVQSEPGSCPICGMDLVPRKADGAGGAAAGTPNGGAAAAHQHGAAAGEGQYWCPMHPEVASDDPNATCEKCGGMKLLPRKSAAPESDVPGLTAVDLSPERVQLMGMRTAPVTREKLAPALRTVGYVAVDEGSVAEITTRFAGWIEALEVNQTGQRVRKGQTLASIYSPELVTAQQEYLNALSAPAAGDGGAVSRLAHGLAADARHRLLLLGISEDDIDRLQASGKAMHALPLRSPVSGHVTRKAAVQGAYVEPGAQLFQIADLSKVWVLIEVYEQDIGRVREGATAQLQLAAYPGEVFAGRVQFIYPTMDAGTRTMRLRLEFKNEGLRLRPGMYGDVSLDLPSVEALVAPADAVVDTGDAKYVFLAAEGGRFVPRRVRTGLEADDRVEILEGLREGETVVTTANFLIDSESRLRSALSGQGAAEGAAVASSSCDTEFDAKAYPDKHAQCRACEVQHAGMGSMADDCKRAIPRPWR